MSSESQEKPEVTPDVFRPSRWRLIFAAAIALCAFFVPQEIPLEWYPLNNPSSGLRYIEITCAANVTSSTQIFLNSGRGINELEKISFPIGPSEMAFTYTFPLADTPLREIRLDPLLAPGELRITNFRLINRRGEELRRFTKDSFSSQHGISAIEPTADGWKMLVGDKSGGRAHIDFSHFTFPEGMNERNLKRCLRSTGYLAFMLWLILLAVYFTFRAAHDPWRSTLASMAFLAFLGIAFSFVGNRGLIRNSVRYALVEVPSFPPGLQLEVDAVSSAPGWTQLFWDIGSGFNENDSVRQPFEDHRGLQTLRFPLPLHALKALRFDPRDNGGSVTIKRIRLVDAGGQTRAVLPNACLEPAHQIAHTEPQQDAVEFDVAPSDHDPVLLFRGGEVARINLIASTPAPTAP